MATKLGRAQFFFALWLAFAILFGAALFPRGIGKTWHIVNLPASTTGSITQVDCGNHDTVSYLFNAANAIHFGTDRIGDDCKTMSVNQKITIFFAQDNPEINEIANPKKRLKDMIQLMISTMILLPLAVAWKVMKILRGRI